MRGRGGAAAQVKGSRGQEVLTGVWLPGGPGGLGGQHVAPALEGEADGSHKRHRGDEVPESEEVRRPAGSGGWEGVGAGSEPPAAAEARARLRRALSVGGWASRFPGTRGPCVLLGGCSLLLDGPLAPLPAVPRGMRSEEEEE